MSPRWWRGERRPAPQRSATDPERCPACHAFGMIGVYVRGVYDGVLFWECASCGHREHRFPVGSIGRQTAEEWIANRWRER